MSAAKPRAVDPLLQLVQEREDEMSPSWRALVGLLRFWLGLFGALGPMVIIVLALQVMASMYQRFGDVGLWSYFIIAMPVSAGLVVGLRRLRVALARKIADAIRARLAGIGGTLTPASFSLGPRRDERR